MSIEYQKLSTGFSVRLSDQHPCPYLPQRMEKDLIISLLQESLPSTISQPLYENLCQLGFRRNGNNAYKPMCDRCQKCLATRILVDHFVPSQSQKRIIQKNHFIRFSIIEPVANDIHYQLFIKYLQVRHQQKIGNLSYHAYSDWIENSPVVSRIIEYKCQEKILGCMIVDVLADGFSAVYSFYDPDFKQLSLGTLMILMGIKILQEQQKPYFYLGYTIKENPRMAYKLNFNPCQSYDPRTGWQDVSKHKI